LYETIVKAQVLFEREGWDEAIARAVMRRLEHVYPKPDIIVDVLEKTAVASVANETSRITPLSAPQTARELVHNLAVYLYSTDLQLVRTRAMLCHIYHNALHGRYHEARDMLLMSHLQDTIQHADVTTQILYNRVVVQLGLAAFKKGYIAECQSTLLEIFSSQKPKELLAQGIQRFSQNTPEQELIEKRRLLPFHLHINLELLETAFLVSCMLQEIPLLASLDSEEQKRKACSKPFKRLLDQADRQTFMGPPENTRDHIMQASKALQSGEWEKAKEMILSIKIWGLLDGAADIKEKLARLVFEELFFLVTRCKVLMSSRAFVSGPAGKSKKRVCGHTSSPTPHTTTPFLSLSLQPRLHFPFAR
jgi:translation initiation factor 3 subunit C